jgi:hypothetical protein
MCINFYYPKSALILLFHSKLIHDMQFSHKLQEPSLYLHLVLSDTCEDKF